MVQASEWGSYEPRGTVAAGIYLLRKWFPRGALGLLIRKAVRSQQPYFDIEVDGLKMRCTDDNHTEWNFVRTDPIQGVGAFKNLAIAELKPGDVFVDVGANCGLFTLCAARNVGPTGRVLAIEPMPELLERLRFNVAVNRFQNVSVYDTAVGDEVGDATLHIRTAQRGQSSMTPVDGYVPVKIPITTLLNIAEQAGVSKIDAMKIDVEGHEDRVLLPFIADAPRNLWPKRIFMEIRWGSRWKSDCVSGLIAAGYRETWRGRGDVLLTFENLKTEHAKFKAVAPSSRRQNNVN